MTILEELEIIRKQHDGILYPRDVVEYAKNPDTNLHSRFDWNDSSAAENYRLWQARKIIKVNVTILPREEKSFNTYVSLKQDRYAPSGEDEELHGGYRSMVDVLSVTALRKTLLEEALDEHDFWEKKYQTVVELAEIFAAAKTVKQKQRLLTPEKINA